MITQKNIRIQQKNEFFYIFVGYETKEKERLVLSIFIYFWVILFYKFSSFKEGLTHLFTHLVIAVIKWIIGNNI